MQLGSMSLSLAIVALGVAMISSGVNGQEGYVPATPPINCQQPYTCTRAGMFVNPNNCNSFYWCVDLGGQRYMPYFFLCGRGLWFDERELICNWPDQVQPVPRCAACWSQILQQYPEAG